MCLRTVLFHLTPLSTTPSSCSKLWTTCTRSSGSSTATSNVRGRVGERGRDHVDWDWAIEAQKCILQGTELPTRVLTLKCFCSVGQIIVPRHNILPRKPAQMTLKKAYDLLRWKSNSAFSLCWECVTDLAPFFFVTSAANLLIDYNCQRLKVADFGCAELLDEGCHRKGLPENKDAGTLWYNPPDVSAIHTYCVVGSKLLPSCWDIHTTEESLIVYTCPFCRDLLYLEVEYILAQGRCNTLIYYEKSSSKPKLQQQQQTASGKCPIYTEKCHFSEVPLRVDRVAANSK